MSDRWWEHVDESPERRLAPLGELIAGLERLDGYPILYEGLPRRAKTVYSKHFDRWSDIAGESVETLHRYPQAGSVTVRAIVMAAKQAVDEAQRASATDDGPAASVERLLARLGDFDRAVLSARTWALDPVPQRTLAAQLGAAARSMGRRDPRIRARFAELLTDPAHRDVHVHAMELRRELGPLTPITAVERALRERGMDLAHDAGAVLLHAAGPYSKRQDWLSHTSIDGDAMATRTIEEAFARDAAPTTDALTSALAGIGMPNETALAYLQRLDGVRTFDDQWVRWGDSIGDKSWAILQVHGRALPADTIATLIDGDYGPRSIPEALSKDPRFHRATRQSWALRDWNLPEYGGLSTEIGARIDAAGGRILIADTVASLVEDFPDVTASSVRSYVNLPAFVTDDGWVRRRTVGDPWPPPLGIHTARGAYLDGPHRVRLAVPVTGDLLRGSGQRIHAAVTAALGLTPGTVRTLSGPRGDVALNWRITQPGGPTMGSARTLATHTGAELGDELLLVFDTAANTIDALRIPAGLNRADRLRLLVGRSVRNPLAALARSLDCEKDRVPEILDRHGERDLLALLDHP